MASVHRAPSGQPVKTLPTMTRDTGGHLDLTSSRSAKLWQSYRPSTLTAGCRSSTRRTSPSLMGHWRSSPIDCRKRTCAHGLIEPSGSERASWRRPGSMTSTRPTMHSPMFRPTKSQVVKLCTMGCYLSLHTMLGVNWISRPIRIPLCQLRVPGRLMVPWPSPLMTWSDIKPQMDKRQVTS